MASIALEHELGFELEIPLPMPAAEFEADFETASSKEEFRSLLGKAKSCYSLPSPSNDRSLSYLAAGQIVLSQCDLLLGVSDGEQSAGVGGTADMLRRARAQGIPTILISARAPHAITFQDAREPLVALASEVRQLLSPSRALKASIDEFKAERWPKHHPFLSYAALRLLGDHQIKFPPRPDPSRHVNEVHSVFLKPYFHWADTLAVYHGERSRSASLRLQLLATVAVIAALLNVPFTGYPLTTRVLSVLEVGSTLWLLLGAGHSRRGHSHDRWLRYRAAAEQLRSIDVLWPLCLSWRPARSEAFPEQSQTKDLFASWFVRAIQRELGIPNQSVNRNFLALRSGDLRTLIGDQISFHRKTSARYKSAEAVLRYCGLTLFSLAFLLGLYDMCHAFGWLPAALLSLLVQQPGFESAIGIVTVLLPALGAAATAIVAQGEYKRLAERSEGMERRLTAIKSQLHETSEPSYETLCTLSNDLADVLLIEVREWSTLVASKPPSLPV